MNDLLTTSENKFLFDSLIKKFGRVDNKHRSDQYYDIKENFLYSYF